MIILALILAFAASWLFYRKTTPQLKPARRYLLFGLRTVVLMIVFLLLLNPIWNYAINKTSRQKIILLSDNSESIDKQKSVFFSKLKPAMKVDLEKAGYQVIEHNFAEGLDGNSSQTLLLKTLADIQKKYDTSEIKAIQLFSDGWFQDEDMQQLQSFQTPINVAFPENNLNYKDLKIENVKHNLKALKNESNPILVTAAASNYDDKAKVELKIQGENVDSQNCDFSNKNFAELNFDHTFKQTGLIPLTVTISSDSLTEANVQNNSFYSAVQVSSRDFKVTILSDELNWDVKFLKDCIKRQSRWKYEVIIPENNNFTVSQQDLAETNVLVIINSGNLKIQNLQLIENYLKNGRAVLSIGKPLDTEFSSVLGKSFRSARQTSIKISPDADKYSSMQLWQAQQSKIPPLSYYFAKPKAQSEVLANFQNDQESPAIMFNFYNEGKVLEFLFQGIWQWQMNVVNSNFTQFFTNIFKWLGSSESGRFIAYPSQNSYTQGEKIKLYLQAYDEAYNLIGDLESKAELFTENGKKIAEKYMTSDQDKYSVVFSSDLNPGRYEFKISATNYDLQTSGEFLLQDAQLEKYNLGFNRNNLNYVSRISGGKTFSNSFEIKLPEAQTSSQKIEQQIPLYKKWYIIALFIICFSLELFLRRKWGLI